MLLLGGIGVVRPDPDRDRRHGHLAIAEGAAGGDRQGEGGRGEAGAHCRPPWAHQRAGSTVPAGAGIRTRIHTALRTPARVAASTAAANLRVANTAAASTAAASLTGWPIRRWPVRRWAVPGRRSARRRSASGWSVRRWALRQPGAEQPASGRWWRRLRSAGRSLRRRPGPAPSPARRQPLASRHTIKTNAAPLRPGSGTKPARRLDCLASIRSGGERRRPCPGWSRRRRGSARRPRFAASGSRARRACAAS